MHHGCKRECVILLDLEFEVLIETSRGQLKVIESVILMQG